MVLRVRSVGSGVLGGGLFGAPLSTPETIARHLSILHPKEILRLRPGTSPSLRTQVSQFSSSPSHSSNALVLPGCRHQLCHPWLDTARVRFCFPRDLQITIYLHLYFPHLPFRYSLLRRAALFLSVCIFFSSLFLLLLSLSLSFPLSLQTDKGNTIKTNETEKTQFKLPVFFSGCELIRQLQKYLLSASFHQRRSRGSTSSTVHSLNILFSSRVLWARKAPKQTSRVPKNTHKSCCSKHKPSENHRALRFLWLLGTLALSSRREVGLPRGTKAKKKSERTLVS